MSYKSKGAVMAVSLLSWLIVTPASAAPQTIKPGEVWPDDRGQHVQAHGGGIIKLGDTYYWFGEDRSQGSRSHQPLRGLLLLEGPGPLDLPQPGHEAGRP